MLISELPEPIRRLAEQRKQNRNLITTFGAFDWPDTPEGEKFWSEIQRGNFAPFYEKYPEHKPATSEQSIKYTVEYCRANKVAIHCETQEQWNRCFSCLPNYKLVKSDWIHYRKHTVMLFYDLLWIHTFKRYAKKQDYAIITAAQFIADNTVQAKNTPQKNHFISKDGIGNILWIDLSEQKIKEDSDMLAWFKQYIKENPEQAKKEWDEICKEIERKPILTTDDGVEIFGDSPVFIVTPKFEIYTHFKAGELNKPTIDKYFSTRAAAEDYVLKNKECFSVADLMKFGIPIYESALINLAKNKLGING